MSTTATLTASTPSLSPVSQWKMSASMPALPSSSSPSLPPPTSTSSSSSSGGGPTPNATLVTLVSLYPRAARAFLQREVFLTHSLLSTAFGILHPPDSHIIDELDTQRRKWDILRISFESTLYADPPPHAEQHSLQPTLRDTLSQTPASLIADLRSRSLRLFSPAYLQKPSSAFVPGQILVSLLLAALKVECPDAAKAVAEDWFVQRYSGMSIAVPRPKLDMDGYEKVVDVYVLHVLPRLEEWNIAFEFMRNEIELDERFRERVFSSLQSLHNKSIEARNRQTARTASISSSHLFTSPNNRNSSTPSPASRSVSPSPSTSSTSSSSSLDTTSTHTVVPNRRSSFVNLAGSLAALTPVAFSSSSSSSSTPSHSMNGHAKPFSTSNMDPSSSKNSMHSSTTTTANGHSKSLLSSPKIAGTSANSDSHQESTPKGDQTLRSTSKNNTIWTNIYHRFASKLGYYISTRSHYILTALFVLVPLITFLLRIRRTRGARGAVAPSVGVGNAVADVRRRLQAQRSVVGSRVMWGVWIEIVNAVLDTIRMAGGGLV